MREKFVFLGTRQWMYNRDGLGSILFPVGNQKISLDKRIAYCLNKAKTYYVRNSLTGKKVPKNWNQLYFTCPTS